MNLVSSINQILQDCLKIGYLNQISCFVPFGVTSTLWTSLFDFMPSVFMLTDTFTGLRFTLFSFVLRLRLWRVRTLSKSTVPRWAFNMGNQRRKNWRNESNALHMHICETIFSAVQSRQEPKLNSELHWRIYNVESEQCFMDNLHRILKWHFPSYFGITAELFGIFSELIGNVI